MEPQQSGKKLVIFWSVFIAVVVAVISLSELADNEDISGITNEKIPQSLEISDEDLQDLFWPEDTSEQYISGYFVGYDIGKHDGYCDGYEAGYERDYDASCDRSGDYERGYLKGYDEGYWDGYEVGDYDKACNYPFNPSP